MAEIERESATKLAALASTFPMPASNSLFAKSWKVCLLIVEKAVTIMPLHAQDVVSTVAATATARETSSVALMAEVCQPLKTLMKEKTLERGERLKEIAQLHTELARHAHVFEKVTGSWHMEQSQRS
jgi:ABC-type uncharacterized transport system YnjBCD substrate-binding protein